jgi:hypothetical protein
MQPKEKRGCGILNLRLQNDALLLKQLSKFYNHDDVPWVQIIWSKYYENKVPHASREVGSFWWKDILRLNDLFCQSATCEVGDGSIVCFWSDNWLHDLNGNLLHELPRLGSFCRDEDVSVKQVMQMEDLDSLFYLPLSMQAMEELETLQSWLSERSYDDAANDRWIMTWETKYTSRRFYKFVFQPMPAHRIFKIVWKSKCIPRIKFFAWLILVDRLNTKDMLRRRHFHVLGGTACIMCNTGEQETIVHLFFECPFAISCWAKLGINWDTNQHLFDRLIETRSTQNVPCLTEAILTAAWELWKVRNDKVFQRHEPTLQRWIANFKSQCLLQSVRFKHDLRSAFCVWLDSFS